MEAGNKYQIQETMSTGNISRILLCKQEVTSQR